MTDQSQPASTELIPPPGDLRKRLAVALREVELLRRLIRLSERFRQRHGGEGREVDRVSR
jgi:hypothetical protein